MHFFVAGVPAPKGSFKAFFVKRLNRAVITNANAKTRPWEQAVRAEAAIAHRGGPWRGPVMLRLVFILPRIQAHYRASGELKPDAPHWSEKKPDLDKLERTLCDALTGIVFVDDAQVAYVEKRKRFVGAAPEQTGIAVTVLPLKAPGR